MMGKDKDAKTEPAEPNKRGFKNPVGHPDRPPGNPGDPPPPAAPEEG